MRAKTDFVSTGTPGLTSTANSGGRRRVGPRSPPTPRIMRALEPTQTGTSAPVARAAAITRSSSMESPFACASNRRAAAASAEPPPTPAATGRRLVRWKAPMARPGNSPARWRAARSTRLSSPSPAAIAVGPSTVSAKAAPGVRLSASDLPAKQTRLSSACQPSGRRPSICKVRLILARARSISIRSGSPQPPFFLASASADVGLGASSRPLSTFFRIRSRSSGSGLRSRAWFHWKWASSLRPTRQ